MFRSKKAFTLTELIISVLFVAVIFATAVSMWYVSGKVFKDTGGAYTDYNQARAFETMLMNAASVAPTFVFGGAGDNRIQEIEKYFAFYYDSDKGHYVVEYTAPRAEASMTIEYDALSSADHFKIGMAILRPGEVSQIGDDMSTMRVLLKYGIGLKSDGEYLIEGGVIMSDLNGSKFGQGTSASIPEAYTNKISTFGEGEILYLEWGENNE